MEIDILFAYMFWEGFLRMKYDLNITNDYINIGKYVNGGGCYTMVEILNKIDIEKYYIFKASSNFRLIDKDDIEKYSKIMLFPNEIKISDIYSWINFIKINNIEFKFLNKPFPPIKILEKVSIIDDK